MKDINSLDELIEYVQGRGATCEVSNLYSLCEKLQQQNTELQKERSNMQATHQSTIESYRKEIAKLQEEKEGLQSLVDFKQQEISVLESSIKYFYEPKQNT